MTPSNSWHCTKVKNLYQKSCVVKGVRKEDNRKQFNTLNQVKTNQRLHMKRSAIEQDRFPIQTVCQRRLGSQK